MLTHRYTVPGSSIHDTFIKNSARVAEVRVMNTIVYIFPFYLHVHVVSLFDLRRVAYSELQTCFALVVPIVGRVEGSKQANSLAYIASWREVIFTYATNP